MNQRLQLFLSAENISQSQFADSIGVARASISHIIAGRNNPGFDFFLNTSRRFPSLNIEWLITGEGKMYKDKTLPHQAQSLEDGSSTQSPAEAEPGATDSPKTVQTPENKRVITKIIVYYNDNTFEEIM